MKVWSFFFARSVSRCSRRRLAASHDFFFSAGSARPKNAPLSPHYISPSRPHLSILMAAAGVPVAARGGALERVTEREGWWLGELSAPRSRAALAKEGGVRQPRAGGPDLASGRPAHPGYALSIDMRVLTEVLPADSVHTRAGRAVPSTHLPSDPTRSPHAAPSSSLSPSHNRHGRRRPPRSCRSARDADRSLACCPQPGVHRLGE